MWSFRPATFVLFGQIQIAWACSRWWRTAKTALGDDVNMFPSLGGSTLLEVAWLFSTVHFHKFFSLVGMLKTLPVDAWLFPTVCSQILISLSILYSLPVVAPSQILRQPFLPQISNLGFGTLVNWVELSSSPNLLRIFSSSSSNLLRLIFSSSNLLRLTNSTPAWRELEFQSVQSQSQSQLQSPCW